MNFEPIQIVANDLNDAYFTLLTHIWNHGRKYKIDTGSFAGAYRLEFDFCSGFINYPHTRPLAPIMPEGIPPTTTDDELDKYFANYLMDSNLEDNEHYRYSSLINGIEHYNEFSRSNNHLNNVVLVKIFDLNGQVIYTNYQIAKSIEEIDLSNYAKGIYFIQVRSDKYSSTEKIILE